MEVKKDLAMRQQRNFSIEFKKQVVEELISGSSRPSQICRRYNIVPSLLAHWKKQYNLGRLDNEPVQEAALQDRIEKLERLVGDLPPQTGQVMIQEHFSTDYNIRWWQPTPH